MREAIYNEVYYEVRTKGDGDFSFFTEPPFQGMEYQYDMSDPDSAIAFAETLKTGYVVKVTEEAVWPISSKETEEET